MKIFAFLALKKRTHHTQPFGC